MDKYETLLNKARQKYSDVVRGYNYQVECLNNKRYLSKEGKEILEIRKHMFYNQMTVLEDVFGINKLEEFKNV